jgi:hypothetical protein
MLHAGFAPSVPRHSGSLDASYATVTVSPTTSGALALSEKSLAKFSVTACAAVLLAELDDVSSSEAAPLHPAITEERAATKTRENRAEFA